jgi:hypothetical protein
MARGMPLALFGAMLVVGTPAFGQVAVETYSGTHVLQLTLPGTYTSTGGLNYKATAT